ncbi:MAG TPA: 50S ribosomal protein L44e [Candidatus Altiarchaeales archaeon]|nr:50S ribosomal protein L44e [Candidatus Altiarchaeales archaeon]
MKLPQTMQTHCPHCNKHTVHDVRLDKKGKERTMSEGRRKYKEVKKGYGGSPRTPKKDIYKVGKRTALILKCKECNKRHQRIYNARTKKRVEIV